MATFFQKLDDNDDNVILPTKGSREAAGWDLYAAQDYELRPGDTMKISTGVRVAKFPNGTFGQIASRSGLASKGICVTGGVIDRDYEGELIVILNNHSRVAYSICRGNRIAQLLFIPGHNNATDDEAEEPELKKRRAKGFGSTGL
jgi:dUTP pyrophosphatase